MIRKTFVLAAALLAFGACATNPTTGPEVDADIHAVNMVEDGGLTVRYDAITDGRDLEIAIVSRSDPAHAIAVIPAGLGARKKVHFTGTVLGTHVHDRLALAAVVRDDAGEVFASCPVK